MRKEIGDGADNDDVASRPTVDGCRGDSSTEHSFSSVRVDISQVDSFQVSRHGLNLRIARVVNTGKQNLIKKDVID